MTIREAITDIDTLYPNAYTERVKRKWLSDIDRFVFDEIIKTHEDAETDHFDGYAEDTPDSTELLVPAPYDDIYRAYLTKEIDRSNGETGKYSNSVTIFNSSYDTYYRYYNRTHMPVQTAGKLEI